MSGEINTVDALVKHHAQITSDALVFALQIGRVDIFKLLLDKTTSKASLLNSRMTNSVTGTTPLHMAAMFGFVEIAQLCLDSGAKVNREDIDGRTPLMIACLHGQAKVASVLLERGASSTSTSKQSETALDLATKQGHQECIDLLTLSRK